MTDEQIIKAIEVCGKPDKCRGCPYHTGSAVCINILMKDVFDLINRQKAEIERLNIELKAMRGAANSYKLENERLLQKLQQLKTEAIKEFAERAKSRFNDLEYRTKTKRKTISVAVCDDNTNWVINKVVPEELDKLVKEMAEEYEEYNSPYEKYETIIRLEVTE